MVDEVVEGKLQKVVGSLPRAKATDGDTSITPSVLPTLEIGLEGMLSQQQWRPPCPEIVPPRGENLKSATTKTSSSS